VTDLAPDTATPAPGTAAAPAEPATPAPRPTFAHPRRRQGFIGPFGGRQIVMALLLIAAVVVAIVGLTAPLGNTTALARPDPRPTPFLIGPAAQGLGPGQAAPDFATTRPDGSPFRLTDLDGRPVTLADLRGKAVWVNFWASWCPPCQSETPVLRQVAAEYRDKGLVVLGISVQESNAADVKAYADKYDLGYRVAADLSGDIFHLYRVYALPTQFFIDPGGRITSVVQGPLDVPSARAQVEAILPRG
jgi:thiol-disulfide isomerase/thioredoxin